MFELETRDGIALLTLAHGKANAMDIAFCDGLAAQLQALAAGPARAVVLGAAGRIFSAGVDLAQLVAGGADYVRAFLPALDRMCAAVYGHPQPVVAALNGHAIAGGCILACCADQRLMARAGGRIGVPELRVGVPFPPLPLEIVRARVKPHCAESVVLGGATYDPEGALAHGLVDELVAGEALADRALAVARHLAEVPAPLYALTKRMLRQPVLERVAAGRLAHGAEIEARWTAPETLAAIADYVEKTINKR